MKTRWSGATDRCPSYTVLLFTSEYALSMRDPEPSAVGCMWVRCPSSVGVGSRSGSGASSHQASTFLRNSVRSICDQNSLPAAGLKAS